MPGESPAHRHPHRPVPVVLLLVAGLLAFGTLGYLVVEDGWSPLEALYMTVITVATVGYGEVRSLSPAGEVFTIVLILTGFTAGALTAGILGNALLANLPGWRRKRMEKAVENLSGHVVICGYGRLGRIVCEELVQAGRVYVVVDKTTESLEELSSAGVPVIIGDATDEGVLKRAGVTRAAGVIAAVHTDADNVFITMTARQLNSQCTIVSRAEDPRTEPKLRLVGANSVVTPYTLGGRRLAHAFLHPSAVGLADLAMGGLGAGASAVVIEEVRLPDPLPEDIDTLAEMRLGQEYGLIAVAVRRADDNRLEFNPRAATPLRANDLLLVMGERKGIDRFLDFVAAQSAAR